MGANTFGNLGQGKSAQEAFKTLVEEDRQENGHSPYSGTIGCKRDFKVITVPSGKDPLTFAHELIDADDPRIADKHGPAGCVKMAEDRWYFFGWAAS